MKPKRKTFRECRAELLAFLTAQGWAVDDTLKTPHATSPDGTPRLYFKTQAIYLSETYAGRHTFAGARSLVSDMREVSGAELLMLARYPRSNVGLGLEPLTAEERATVLAKGGES